MRALNNKLTHGTKTIQFASQEVNQINSNDTLGKNDKETHNSIG